MIYFYKSFFNSFFKTNLYTLEMIKINSEKINNFLSGQVKGNYFGTLTKYATKCLQTIGKNDGVYNDVIDGNFGPKTLATAEHYGFKY